VTPGAGWAARQGREGSVTMYGHWRMPFGKHKGRPLSDVPTDYLCWLLDECDLRPGFRRAVDAELRGRLYGGAGRGDPGHAPPDDWLSEVLRRWYRELSLKYHPDRGGSHEAMVAVNDAHERLQRMVRELGR